MDRIGRKRSALGSNSPPACENGTKRRSATLDAASNKENAGSALHSDFAQEKIQPGLPTQCPMNMGSARRPLIEINQNRTTPAEKIPSHCDKKTGNSTPQVTHNSSSALTYQSRQTLLESSKQQNPQIPFQMPTSMISPGAGFHNKALQNASTSSQFGQNKLNSEGSLHKDTTSQRMLESFNSSGVTYKSPISRILQGNSTLRTPHSAFQMPASMISPSKTNQSKVHSRVNKRLLESYNRDKGLPMSPSMLYIKEAGIKSKSTEFGSSRNRSLHTATHGSFSDEIDIPVFVPELEELNVRCPYWMSSDSVLRDINWQTSTPEVRNLMDSFNAAENIVKGFKENINETSTSRIGEFMQTNNIDESIPDNHNAGDDTSNIDESDDDDYHSGSHQRGEYISDDESKSSVINSDLWRGYMDLGKPDKICQKCKARMWNEERNNKAIKKLEPTFSICCRDGRIQLPEDRPAPPFLSDLLSGGEKTTHFMKNIRTYNSMFAFTSMGGKIDRKINNGNGPYIFKLNGQNYHYMGSLKPEEGNNPKFCQLYFYDTENEIQNRMQAIPGSDHIDPDIVEGLLTMLDENNKLVHQFRDARQRFKLDEQEEFELVLVSSKSASGRPNHVGPSNEVAGLIVGDAEGTSKFKDIIVKTKQGYLKRIYETYIHYMQLQYPLLFPYGDDGFHLDIPLHPNPNARSTKKTKIPDEEQPDEQTGERTSRNKVSMREYYAYKLMIRPDQGVTLHLGGRLWQQFVVDAFAAVEQYRLDWIRENQMIIRSDLYKSIRDSIRKGDTNPEQLGKKVILPATFTGSQRYMNQYFKDSLAICRSIGHPSLFLTMTCNTKWPEIEHMLEHMPGVDASDAPHVIARVFKLKLDQLIDLIKNKNYFGRCIGVMHVIEFQKRGLPHTHMLIWLHPNDRPKSIEQIDQLISAEIPDQRSDPVGYEVVKNFMIHGPCGTDFKNSPCMVKNRCIRHFPKRYNGRTCFDDCGFPLYRRRRMERTVKKKGIILDDRYVVPYNRDNRYLNIK